METERLKAGWPVGVPRWPAPWGWPGSEGLSSALTGTGRSTVGEPEAMTGGLLGLGLRLDVAGPVPSC